MNIDEDQQTATTFLRRLERALGPLPADERSGILAELEGHIAERRRGGADIPTIMQGLGAPESLARDYVQDHELAGAVNRASPAALLANMLARSTRSAFALCAGFAACLLYLVAGSLLLAAAVKPVAPAHVGLWTGAAGAQFGFVSTAPGDERLGLWFIPIAVAGAMACYVAGTAVIRRCGRRLLESTRPGDRG